MALAFLFGILIIGPLVLACLIVRGFYRKACRADHLEGQLIESQKATDAWKEHAKEAMRLAYEKHFPSPVERVESERRGRLQSRGNYKPPSVQNCPKCFVSVRAESWPQQCPHCRTLFNSDGTLDLIEADELE